MVVVLHDPAIRDVGDDVARATMQFAPGQSVRSALRRKLLLPAVRQLSVQRNTARAETLLPPAFADARTCRGQLRGDHVH